MSNLMYKFNTESEFLEFQKSSDFSNNTVSLIKENGTVYFGPVRKTTTEIENHANDIIKTIINTSY